MDVGYLRLPFRGWFLKGTGEDMELNGCEPDIALWNPPGGPDLQLEAAVKALSADVATELQRDRARPVPAAAKRAKTKANGHK